MNIKRVSQNERLAIQGLTPGSVEVTVINSKVYYLAYADHRGRCVFLKMDSPEDAVAKAVDIYAEVDGVAVGTSVLALAERNGDESLRDFILTPSTVANSDDVIAFLAREGTRSEEVAPPVGHRHEEVEAEHTPVETGTNLVPASMYPRNFEDVTGAELLEAVDGEEPDHVMARVRHLIEENDQGGVRWFLAGLVANILGRLVSKPRRA